MTNEPRTVKGSQPHRTLKPCEGNRTGVGKCSDDTLHEVKVKRLHATPRLDPDGTAWATNPRNT